MNEWEKVKVQSLMYIDICSGGQECELISNLIIEAEKEIAELKGDKTQLINKRLEMLADNYESDLDTAKSAIKLLAENLFCAGEVIKNTNNELGEAYKVTANKYLKEGDV